MQDNSSLVEIAQLAKQLDADFRTSLRAARSNPCKEARLLEAMKPFLAQESQGACDSLIETMAMLNSAQELNKKTLLAESEIHPDGVYDIDSECLARKRKQPKPPARLATQNLMPLLLMMVMKKSPAD